MDSVKYHAGGSGGPPSLRDWSKRVRLTLSDPNFVSGAMYNINNLNQTANNSSNKDAPAVHSSSNSGGCATVNMGRTYPSLLELKGLARRFGLKLMALRGGAIYLSTEAFYLELKENGEEILHILNPESIEVLPPGGDLVAHLQGLMELRPQDWKDLSRLSEELKSRIGKDFIPRLGGTPAQIRFSPHALPISIRPKEDHFILEMKEPFPLAQEKVADLEKASGFPLGLSEDKDKEEFLLDLIAPESPLSMNLPDQRHRYYFAQHMLGVTLSSIHFRSASQIPDILSILKVQALYNTLIASCGELSNNSSGTAPSSLKSDLTLLTFEVSSLNLSHISISFEHPVDEGITALEILLHTPSKLRTKLYYSGGAQHHRTNECSDLMDRVLAQYPSIPLIMRMVIKFYESVGSEPPPLTNSATVTNVSNNPSSGGGGFYGRKPEKTSANNTANNANNTISFDSTAFTVDSLNAKGPQEEMCAPGAASPALSKKTSLVNSTSLTTTTSTTSATNNSSKRKHYFDEQNIKPVVSITPVSEAHSTSSSGSILDKKIGIEIIPLGGGSSNKFSSSKSSSPVASSNHRDIKRSLSEDDKRVVMNKSSSSQSSANRKDKKRKQHSPPMKLPTNLTASKKVKVSSSPDGKKDRALISSSMDSIKVTIKSKNPPKSAPGSPKIHSSKQQTKTKHNREQRLLLQEEQQEEVKRLLTGGKLLNKTFQIPKISKDSDSSREFVSSTEKKIPSLMSLTPPPLYSVKESTASSNSSSSSSNSSKFGSPISSPRGRSSISPVLAGAAAKRTSPSSSKSGSSSSNDDITILDHF